ncbi:MAG: uroporphyrinogen decarboxylase family protein [Victivallaceae bacterium]|nr:uroporphyrinogen decarboxylase family protein [Victivallaceae bacterium]
MSKTKMSSKERVCCALRRQAVDYVPCSPFFNPLTEVQRRGHAWQFPWKPGTAGIERLRYLRDELGIDPVCEGSLYSPHHQDKNISERVWLDKNQLHKIIKTPAGELHSVIAYNAEWPFGKDIPLYHDFIGHNIEPWLKNESDLECIRHLIAPPDQGSAAELRVNLGRLVKDARHLELPVIVDIGKGLTGMQQLCGAAELCLMTVENPDLVHAYLEYEHQANLRHIEIAASQGVDIIRRNGFYESCDFYSPAMLKEFLGARLQAEAEAAHSGGCLFAYTLHTGVMPMLDYLKDLNFDCLMQVDIAFKTHDIKLINRELGGQKSFWTGPSNTYHMWSENPDDVRNAVRQCFACFGREGLLITACPSSHSIMPWANTLAMIDEWKKLRQV